MSHCQIEQNVVGPHLWKGDHYLDLSNVEALLEVLGCIHVIGLVHMGYLCQKRDKCYNQSVTHILNLEQPLVILSAVSFFSHFQKIGAMLLSIWRQRDAPFIIEYQ